MRQSPRLAVIAKLRVPSLALGLVASAAFIFASSDANAVMRGQGAGAISRHVIKMVGHNLLCTATVIGRQQLLTANHCVEGSGPFFVVAGARRIAVASHSASGQTTQLTLASPLPAQYVPIATGSASGEGTYTIAGYGFLTHYSSVGGTSTYAAAPEGTTRQVSEPRQPRRVAGKGKRSRWAAW